MEKEKVEVKVLRQEEGYSVAPAACCHGSAYHVAPAACCHGGAYHVAPAACCHGG